MSNVIKQTTWVLDILEKNGYEGYLVGGAVRDMILNRDKTDIDITTNAKPDEVLYMFEKYMTIKTGMKHGTIIVSVEDLLIDITTYRVDGEYIDNRRPEAVHFSLDLEEDLRRRDFTMNAVAYHPTKGFIDPCNGCEDINIKRIKAVGKPQLRFEEDSLRILRGLRFTAEIDFIIEEKTYEAMVEKKALLKNIASERIYVEFSKAIVGKNASECFKKYYKVWGEVFPEIMELEELSQNKLKSYFDALLYTPPIMELRMGSFFSSIYKCIIHSMKEKGEVENNQLKEIALGKISNILKRLRSSKKMEQKIIEIITNIENEISVTKIGIKTALMSLEEDTFFDIIKVKKGFAVGRKDIINETLWELESIEKGASKIIKEKDCYRLKHLALTGKDIEKAGYDGKEIGAVLNRLLEKVIYGQVENNKIELLLYLKKNYQKIMPSDPY